VFSALFGEKKNSMELLDKFTRVGFMTLDRTKKDKMAFEYKYL